MKVHWGCTCALKGAPWFPDYPSHTSYSIHFKFGIWFGYGSVKKPIDFGACRCTGGAPVHQKVHPGFRTILTAILIRFTSNLEYSLGIGSVKTPIDFGA